jgi:hypothetical protein
MKINLKDWKSVLTALSGALVSWSLLKYSVEPNVVLSVVTTFLAGGSVPTSKK